MASRAETSGAESSDAYPVYESTLSQRHVHCQPPTSAKPPPTSTSAELPPTSITAKLPPKLPPKSSSPTEHVYQQGMHAFTSARALLRAEVASGLNLQPSLFLFIPMLLASMLTSAFLEDYVRETKSRNVARSSKKTHVSFRALPYITPRAFFSPTRRPSFSHSSHPVLSMCHTAHFPIRHTPCSPIGHTPLLSTWHTPCSMHITRRPPATPHPAPPRWSSLPWRISPSLRSARTLSSPRTLYATT